MEEIAESEIDASKRLAELCAEDSRLGFHSEAETHMYSKERLQWRADSLKDTLNQIAAVKNILREGGKLPESSFEKNAPKVQAGAQWNEAPSTRWKISECSGGIKFEAQLRGDYGYDEFSVAMLDAAGTIFPLTVKVNGNSVADESGLFETKIERSGDLKKVSIFLPNLAYAGKEIKPSWIFVRRDAAGSPTTGGLRAKPYPNGGSTSAQCAPICSERLFIDLKFFANFPLLCARRRQRRGDQLSA